MGRRMAVCVGTQAANGEEGMGLRRGRGPLMNTLVTYGLSVSLAP